jgi:hypothetical protein
LINPVSRARYVYGVECRVEGLRGKKELLKPKRFGNRKLVSGDYGSKFRETCQCPEASGQVLEELLILDSGAPT